MISEPLPYTEPPCLRFRSTMSSATRRCPRVTRSNASSLLPIPLLPRMSTPTPITSIRTPCTEVLAVSASWRKRSMLSMKAEERQLEEVADALERLVVAQRGQVADLGVAEHLKPILVDVLGEAAQRKARLLD